MEVPIQPPRVIAIDGRQYTLLKLGRPLHASVATARLINSTHFHVDDLTIVDGGAAPAPPGGPAPPGALPPPPLDQGVRGAEPPVFVIWCTLTADQKIATPDLVHAVVECSRADGCLPVAPPTNLVQITLPDGRLATVAVMPRQVAEPKRGRRPGQLKRK